MTSFLLVREGWTRMLQRISQIFVRVSPLAWLLLCVVFIYAPSIFFGRAFFEFDSFSVGYAYAGYFAAHPFGWLQSMYTNAYHSGANVVFNPIVGLFGLLMTLTPLGVSYVAFWDGIVCLFFLFFAWVTYVFFRDRGLPPASAAALASLVIFSQRFVAFFSSWIWVGAYAVFPAICVVLKRYADTGQKRWIVAGGVVGASAVFFGQPGILVFLTMPIMAYAIFLITQQFRKGHAAGTYFVLGLGGMALVALLLAGWYLLPTMRLASDTPRSQGFSFTEMQGDALHLGNIAQLVLPHWSLYTSSEPMMFMAALGLAFVILSFAYPPTHTEERFWRWLVLGCVVFALPFSPLAWIASHLPVFKSAREPARMLFAAMFGLGILAGAGLRAYRKHWETLHQSRIARMLRVVLSGLLIGILSGSLFDVLGGFGWLERQADTLFDKFFYRHTTGMALTHYHDVITTMIGTVQDTVHLLNPMTLLTVSGLMTAWIVLRRRTKLDERTLLACLVLFSFGYALLFSWHVQRISAQAVEADPASARFIRVQPNAELFREYTLFFGSSKFEFLDTPLLNRASAEDQYAYGRDLLNVDTNIHYGIQSIDGYDNFMTRRTSNLLNEVLSEAMPTGHQIARSKKTRAEKIAIFNDRLNIVGMMNVKYVLSAYELPTSALRLVWSGETTSQKIPIYLYENPLVLPRVFFARTVIALPEDENRSLVEVLKPGRNFQKETLLECASCAIPSGLSSSDTVQMIAYQPGHVSLKTTTQTPRLLVFSENNLRGWHGAIDGKETLTSFANYLYQGLIVPAGTHTVVFRYARP